ncbi:hypothetical protein FE257_003366 [Aspergillus nanangensis]|uniref:Uncharacterized protein n=1 Tax=Aspergillus nanangensis TaxID=2582783 RepID=A0AAD4CCX6_ASPNN|nr:hypothetical protein FE257_003366 [Aspergillus nanangensis]
MSRDTYQQVCISFDSRDVLVNVQHVFNICSTYATIREGEQSTEQEEHHWGFCSIHPFIIHQYPWFSHNSTTPILTTKSIIPRGNIRVRMRKITITLDDDVGSVVEESFCRSTTHCLQNTDDETSNYHQLPQLSDDEAQHALYYACKIQSTVSRDELIKLYQKIAMSTPRLVDYDIEENSLPLSSSRRFVDPALISLGQCALADNITTLHPPPASDRYHSPALSSSTSALSEPFSTLFDEKFHGHSVSSVLPEHRPIQGERHIESPNMHENFENDFDSAFQELEILLSSRPSPDDLPGSYGGTNAPDPHMCSQTEGFGSQGIQNLDADEDVTMTNEQEAAAFMCGRVDGMSYSVPHGFPPPPSVGNAQERCNNMGIVDVEDTHQQSPAPTGYDKHPSKSHSRSPGPSSARGGACSVTEPTTLDTPTTPIPAKQTTQSADRRPGENFSAGQTSDNFQSEQYLSKYQPTVEDMPDEDEFLDSDVRIVIEDMCAFPGMSSGEHKSRSCQATNTTNTDFEPNASALSESNEQHIARSKERTATPQAAQEESSKIYRKRRHASSSKSQPALSTRNLRARPNKSVVQEVNRPEHYEDHWEGRFSHHTLLATLLPDKKDEIERKSNRLLRSDLPEFMDKHTKLWNLNGFWPSLVIHPHKLPSMATLSKGHETWRYVKAMEAEEETHYLKARLADVKLFLEYVEELNRQKLKHPYQSAITRAIDKICGNTRQTAKAQKDKNRSSFHEHKLRGERWWWCGYSLGLF